MKTRITHIQKQREQYESNQLTLVKELGLSQSDYFWIVVDKGLNFLATLYPINSSFERYRAYQLQSPLFWKWWRAEWKHTETAYIRSVKELGVPFKIQDFEKVFTCSQHHEEVEKSYHNIYLKSINDEQL